MQREKQRKIWFLDGYLKPTVRGVVSGESLGEASFHQSQRHREAGLEEQFQSVVVQLNWSQSGSFHSLNQ